MILFADVEKDEEDLSGEFFVKAPEIPDISASEMVESLKQWEGMDQAIDLFKELLIAESGRYALLP